MSYVYTLRLFLLVTIVISDIYCDDKWWWVNCGQAALQYDDKFCFVINNAGRPVLQNSFGVTNEECVTHENCPLVVVAQYYPKLTEIWYWIFILKDGSPLKFAILNADQVETDRYPVLHYERGPYFEKNKPRKFETKYGDTVVSVYSISGGHLFKPGRYEADINFWSKPAYSVSAGSTKFLVDLVNTPVRVHIKNGAHGGTSDARKLFKLPPVVVTKPAEVAVVTQTTEPSATEAETIAVADVIPVETPAPTPVPVTADPDKAGRSGQRSTETPAPVSVPVTADPDKAGRSGQRSRETPAPVSVPVPADPDKAGRFGQRSSDKSPLITAFVTLITPIVGFVLALSPGGSLYNLEGQNG